MFASLILFITLVVPTSRALEKQEQPARAINTKFEEQPWKTLQLAVIVESKSTWTAETAAPMIEQANQILVQCRIALAVHSQINIYMGTLSMDYDAIPVANDFYRQLQMPLLFLVEATQYNGSAGWAPGSNYLFVSSYALSAEYRDLRNPEYEILAHELGHMLGGLQNLAHEQNLMAGYIANQTAALTTEQCQSLRSSEHFDLGDGNYF